MRQHGIGLCQAQAAGLRVKQKQQRPLVAAEGRREGRQLGRQLGPECGEGGGLTCRRGPDAGAVVVRGDLGRIDLRQSRGVAAQEAKIRPERAPLAHAGRQFLRQRLRPPRQAHPGQGRVDLKHAIGKLKGGGAHGREKLKR